MKKLSLNLIILAAAAMILAACSPTAAQPAAAPTATKADILIAEGRLLPVNTLDHAFSLPGQVGEVLVKDGDDVKVGQVLARLVSAPEAQAALARAQQEALAAQQALDGLKVSAGVNLTQSQLAVIAAQKLVDSAQSRYDADKSDENKAQWDAAAAKMKLAEDTLASLKSGQGVDPDAMAAAEARLKSAKAALASSQAAIDALELKASIAGTLVDPTLQAGQRVSAGQPVFTVADFSRWVVKTDNLTEVQVVNVKVGQKVELVLDAMPEATLSGEVSQINRRYEEKRGDITYTVTVVLNETDANMRWGMTAAVKFLP